MQAIQNQPAIIESALNGGRGKHQNPHVPVTTDELVDDAVACLAAGAAIVHTHAPNRPTDPETATALYLAHFLPVLATRPDALLYPTIVFADAIDQRVGHLPLLAARGGLRMGLMEPGSGTLVATADDGLPTVTHAVYTNSSADIRAMADLCRTHALGPSMVIFEPGFLRHALVYHDRGALPPGAFLRLTLCGGASYRGLGHVDLLCGLPNTPAALDAYLDMLGDAPIAWAVSVVSGDVFDNGVARHALERGGHLRVGLEDYAGPDHPTNVELVERAVALVEEVGRPLASPTTAASLIGLPVIRSLASGA